jgi:hypothetical protein
MPIMFWNPTLAEEHIMRNAAERLDRVGLMMADEVRKKTPVGTISRPIYTRGKYADKYWTSRDAGALKKTVRVTKQGDGRYHNIWIMCGNTKAYYGKIIEHDKPFFRPAINKAKNRARIILSGGGGI